MPEKKLWIIEVVEELQNIPLEECEDRGGEVEEGDHVVGEMSPDLRRLFTHMARSGDRLRKYAMELQDSALELHDMMCRFKLLTNIFWACVRDEFPELRIKPSSGARRGNKVMWSEEKTEEMMAIQLDRILGHGSERALAKVIAFMSHRPGGAR